MSLEKAGSLLGIPLNKQTRQILWQEIIKIAEAPYSRCFSVMTPNPEILSYAYQNSAYAEALRSADFSLADGIGVVLIALLSGQKFQRFTGADLSADLLKLSQEQKYRVAILDKVGGLSLQADLKNKLSVLYPAVKFGVWKIEPNEDNFQIIIQAINEYMPDLLLISIGFPYQEKFIANYQHQLHCKLALGIGGSLDFIIGNRKRPPRYIRKLGLEWLYRFIEDPKYRAKRIFTVLFIFPFLNFKYWLVKLLHLK